MSWSGRWTSKELTPREVEVLLMLCAGLRCKQIAAKLNCSTRTVTSHIYNISKKSGCTGPALGLWAARNGIVSIEHTPEGQASPRLGAAVSPTDEQGGGQAHTAASEGQK